MDKYKQLLSFLEEGEQLGLNLLPIIEKVKNFIENNSQEKFRIVLLGSFSDGKTTLIGGLMGQLLKNMKIDQGESSDQLEIYQVSFLDHQFEVVDTPGLFGTKEKEVEGKNIKFSDITIRYISEADIMIYVCDAVNPFKSSHTDVMRRILIDYNKLNSTIFVINKMDEAGTMLLDEEDYDRMSKIKKENLIGRLKDCIGLTLEQEKNLKIVCVAADPKQKGLAHWFTKMDDYYRRSHIGEVIKLIQQFTSSVDKDSLKAQTNQAVVTDVLTGTYKELSSAILCQKKIIKNSNFELGELSSEMSLLNSDLKRNKKTMSERIAYIQDDILFKVNTCGLETIGALLEELGMQDGKLTFYRLIDKVSQEFTLTAETNDAKIGTMNETINVSFDKMDQFVKGLFEQGITKLQGVNLANTDILKARDAFAKIFKVKYKFKPHGAKNLAANIGKVAKYGGAALSGVLMAHDLWQTYKNNKKLAEAKTELKNALNKLFAEDILPLYQTDQAYYKNFASNYLPLSSAIDDLKTKLDEQNSVIQNYDVYKKKIRKLCENEHIDIVDVDFEEI